MSDYFVIDADCHVEEPEQAWNYLQDKYKERGDISEIQKRKILADNARRIFALSTRCNPVRSRQSQRSRLFLPSRLN